MLDLSSVLKHLNRALLLINKLQREATVFTYYIGLTLTLTQQLHTFYVLLIVLMI